MFSPLGRKGCTYAWDDDDGQFPLCWLYIVRCICPQYYVAWREFELIGWLSQVQGLDISKSESNWPSHWSADQLWNIICPHTPHTYLTKSILKVFPQIKYLHVHLVWAIHTGKSSWFFPFSLLLEVLQK